MISGFLTSVPSDHASISRNALRWLLISTIFYSGFFSSEAFDKRTNRVSTDVADKHGSLYKRDCYLVRRSRECTNELAIMAHIVASIAFVNAPVSAAKVRHCKRKDCPDASFLCRENGGQQVMFFWHLHVLPPIRGFAHLIRNKVDYW